MKGELRQKEIGFQSMNLSYVPSILIGSEVVGVHGYNAFMHEGAFRIMEPTLPQQYQKEEILQKQRAVHGKLINVGILKTSGKIVN